MYEIEVHLGTELVKTVNAGDRDLPEVCTMARVMYADYQLRNPRKQVFIWVNDAKGNIAFAINEDND